MQTSIQQNQAFTAEIFHTDDLQEWVDMFLYSCRSRNLALGTVLFYGKKLGAFIKFCSDLAITNISQITPEVIRKFLIYLEEHHHKPAGVHCYYRALKTFLRWYEAEIEHGGWKNPIEKVRAPIVPLEPLDPVSVETIRAMIKADADCAFINLRDKAILMFLLDSGVRLGELLALNRNDVNLITGEALVRNGKGRKPRNVYLGEKARQTLKRYLRERRDYNSALWVGRSGERLTESGLRMILRRRSTRAGVVVPSPHSFRRAFALERWRAGTDIVTLSKLMGHSSLQVLTRYLKQAGEDLAMAARETSPVDLNF